MHTLIVVGSPSRALLPPHLIPRLSKNVNPIQYRPTPLRPHPPQNHRPHRAPKYPRNPLPSILNAHVLDLACGSGTYSFSFLDWGASFVLGVDVSPVMLDEARRKAADADQGAASTGPRRIEFIEADCVTPVAYAGGPFDIVFGAWLLNYAPTRTALVSMFRTISLNLKPGGRFISVTLPPTSSPTAFIATELALRPPPGRVRRARLQRYRRSSGRGGVPCAWEHGGGGCGF